ncbi:MAG: hypothetical protein LBT71_01165 [Azoarcus sp.]|nr:hypothetical protein [Azoarcus sp.]
MPSKLALWHVIAMAAVLVIALKEILPSPYHPDRTPKMNDIPPRIAALFEKTRPVCFGRFMIDIPEKARLIWGPARLSYDLNVYPDGGPVLGAQIKAAVDKITSEQHRTEPSMLIGVFDSVNPDSKIVVGYSHSYNDGYADYYSYIRLGKTAFVQKIIEEGLIILDKSAQYGYRDDKMAYKETVEDLRDLARRLRLRAENEAPLEPGVCIQEGFVSAGLEFKELELISVGFRFPEYPDVSLSVQTWSTDEPNEEDTLEAYLERGRKRAGALGLSELYKLIRTIRKGDRVIGPWEGAEVLGRMPGQEGGPSTHEFVFMSKGVGNDYIRPSITLRFYTGVKENEKASVSPSLDNDEAVALWDKLTSTIRARPTAEKAAEEKATEEKAPW